MELVTIHLRRLWPPRHPKIHLRVKMATREIGRQNTQAGRTVQKYCSALFRYYSVRSGVSVIVDFQTVVRVQNETKYEWRQPVFENRYRLQLQTLPINPSEGSVFGDILHLLKTPMPTPTRRTCPLTSSFNPWIFLGCHGSIRRYRQRLRIWT